MVYYVEMSIRILKIDSEQRRICVLEYWTSFLSLMQAEDAPEQEMITLLDDSTSRYLLLAALALQTTSSCSSDGCNQTLIILTLFHDICTSVHCSHYHHVSYLLFPNSIFFKIPFEAICQDLVSLKLADV